MTHPASHGDDTPRPGAAHPGALEARVVAVVVTYNRETLLAQCLDALAAQERRPDAVVIIDNASTDSSGAVAARNLGCHLTRVVARGRYSFAFYDCPRG